MTFRYTFDADDMASWLLYYLRTSPKRRRGRLSFAFAYFVLAATIASCFFYYSLSLKAFAIGVAATVLFSLFGWFQYKQIVESKIREQARQPHLQQSYGLVEMTLTEEGIREVTPVIDLLMKWQGVTEVIRERDYVYIRHSSGQTVIVSRRSYHGPVPFEELPRVVEEFRKKHSA